MELSWSTFILEMINFLVLVWILKRFLYAPVLNLIARRREGIEKSLEESKALKAEAEALREKYEGRLASWDEERKRARAALQREIEAERARKMAEMQGALEREREKARVADARRRADAVREMEEKAVGQGARFASLLLARAAGPELQRRMLDLLVEGLSRLQPERIAALRENWGRAPESVVVASAFPLSDDERRKLKQALSATLGLELPLRFEEDTELLAGVRINVGAWVLGANLRDELEGFTKLADDDQRIFQAE